MFLAVGYGRVSLIEQGSEDRFSLPHQKEHIRQECASRGWKLVNYFEDTESGGSTKKRKGFKAALKAMEQADVLVVHEMDRLSRNLIDTLLIADDLHRTGKKFVSIHDGIDSSSEQGELQMHILAVFAHYFRKQLARKVHGGMATKAKSGEWNGRAPFGYRVKNKKLIIEKQEALVVKKAFDLYLNHNIGMRGIAKHLNENGHRTLYGKLWTATHIKNMLTNITYTGDTVWNATKYNSGNVIKNPKAEWIIVENTHPPIIDREVFKAVQARIKTKRGMSGRSQASPYLLTGILVCNICGYKMVGSRTLSGVKNIKKLSYYMCSNYHRSGSCENKRTRADLIDGLVKATIEKILGPKDEVNKLIDKYDRSRVIETDHIYEEVKLIEKQLKNIPVRKDRQLEAYELGEISFDELKLARARLDKQIHELTERLNLLKVQLKGVNEDEIKKIKLSDYWDVFSKGDILQQKAWIQDHFEKIVFSGNKIHLTFKD